MPQYLYLPAKTEPDQVGELLDVKNHNRITVFCILVTFNFLIDCLDTYT